MGTSFQRNDFWDYYLGGRALPMRCLYPFPYLLFLEWEVAPDVPRQHRLSFYLRLVIQAFGHARFSVLTGQHCVWPIQFPAKNGALK